MNYLKTRVTLRPVEQTPVVSKEFAPVYLNTSEIPTLDADPSAF